MRYLILILLFTACGDRDLKKNEAPRDPEAYQDVMNHFLGIFIKVRESNNCGGVHGFPESFTLQELVLNPQERYDEANHLVDYQEHLLLKLRSRLDEEHELITFDETFEPLFPFNFRRVDGALYRVTLPFSCGFIEYSKGFVP